MRLFLLRYEKYLSEVTRVARAGIPVVPIRVQGLMIMSQVQVPRDAHKGGRPIDDDECFRALRMVARLHDGVETLVESRNVPRIEGKPRK